VPLHRRAPNAKAEILLAVADAVSVFVRLLDDDDGDLVSDGDSGARVLMSPRSTVP
jgi:hypothetical protein